MPVFKGRDSGIITGIPLSIPSTINSFSIVNSSGGSATVTVSISDKDELEITPITAIDYTLAAGQAYIRSSPILVLPNYKIYIDASAQIDFYFSII